jgi:hypothetical protein
MGSGRDFHALMASWPIMAKNFRGRSTVLVVLIVAILRLILANCQDSQDS